MMDLGKPSRWLKLAASLVIAGGAFIATPAQAATVTINSCTSGNSYQTISVDSSGNVIISCQAGSAFGTLAFSQNPYPGTINNPVTLTVSRNNGTASTATVQNVAATGPACGTVSPSSLNWADGEGGSKTLTLTNTGTAGACTVSGNAVLGSGSSAISTVVNFTDPNGPGTFVLATPSSGPVAGGPAVNIVIQRQQGVSGSYTVPFTATGSGLTGATIAEATPQAITAVASTGTIAFGNGESAKNLSFTPGSTAGSLTLTLGNPTHVSGTTGATSNTTPLTVGVGTGGCQAPAGTVDLGGLGGSGSLTQEKMSSGAIGYIAVPTLNGSTTAAEFVLSSIQISGEITFVEAGISPCPGDIHWGKQGAGNHQSNFGAYPCYTETSNLNNIALWWHSIAPNSPYYCHVPNNANYYLNIRYTIPGCSYGQGGCGMFLQWNRRN